MPEVILTPGDDVPSEPNFEKLPFYYKNRRGFFSFSAFSLTEFFYLVVGEKAFYLQSKMAVYRNMVH